MRIALLFGKHRVIVGPVVFSGRYEVISLDEPIFGNTGAYGGVASCLGTARFDDLTDIEDCPDEPLPTSSWSRQVNDYQQTGRGA